ncbi:MAG: tetratricopeptide repeat protein, partial [Candidatus Latescibacteria bacterium]|nr:tetratricopeptide repeat protein [Candidatus Latescibacterota bacterium]
AEVDALLVKGEQLFQEGDLLGAEERFREALRRDERAVRAYNNLGVVGWRKGDLHTALSSFNKALGIDSWNGDALVNSAEVYRTLGYRDEAIVRLRRYLQMHGDDQEVKRELNKLLGEKV